MKSVLNIHWKDWCWRWTPILWPPDEKNWFLGKNPDAGIDWRQEEKVMTEDEMAGWHHQLNGHEFEWALGVDDGQGILACCNPWTQLINWNELNDILQFSVNVSFHWTGRECESHKDRICIKISGLPSFLPPSSAFSSLLPSFLFSPFLLSFLLLCLLSF